ncbi:MAG: hypothetical protein WBR18_06440 [Anaerolineales bacterium]
MSALLNRRPQAVRHSAVPLFAATEAIRITLILSTRLPSPFQSAPPAADSQRILDGSWTNSDIIAPSNPPESGTL